MKYILTSNEMREIDTATSESIGVPSSVLMERAALVCAEEIKSSGFEAYHRSRFFFIYDNS